MGDGRWLCFPRSTTAKIFVPYNRWKIRVFSRLKAACMHPPPLTHVTLIQNENSALLAKRIFATYFCDIQVILLEYIF